MQTKYEKTAVILHRIAFYVLLVLGIFTFVFALFSGAEGNDEGVMGIVKNSPNALPWVVLLILVWIAAKHDLTGGILIELAAVAAAIFLFTKANAIHPVPLVLLIVIALMGIFFIISGFLRRKHGLE